jgi:hypothetical protein
VSKCRHGVHRCKHRVSKLDTEYTDVNTKCPSVDTEYLDVNTECPSVDTEYIDVNTVSKC